MHRWGYQTQVRFSCLKKSRVVLNYTRGQTIQHGAFRGRFGTAFLHPLQRRPARWLIRGLGAAGGIAAGLFLFRNIRAGRYGFRGVHQFSAEKTVKSVAASPGCFFYLGGWLCAAVLFFHQQISRVGLAGLFFQEWEWCLHANIRVGNVDPEMAGW